jgi:hypothetical protein
VVAHRIDHHRRPLVLPPRHRSARHRRGAVLLLRQERQAQRPGRAARPALPAPRLHQRLGADAGGDHRLSQQRSHRALDGGVSALVVGARQAERAPRAVPDLLALRTRR